MKSPLLLLFSMVEIIRREHLCYAEAESLLDKKTLRDRFKHEGMSFFSKTLPTLDAAILAGIENGTFICPTAFARDSKSRALPRFLRGLLCRMFEPNTGKLLEFEPLLLKNIRQLLLSFKKVQLSSSNFQMLERKAKVGFLRMDDETDFSYERTSDRRKYILNRISSIALHDLNYNRDELKGKHGPGAVYEKLSPNGKWSHLAQASCLLDAPMLNPITEAIHIASGLSLFVDSRGIKSRLIAVPKNSTSVRLITVEPCVKQFMQGGINLFLRDYIKKSKIFSTCLRLTDQAFSREFARIGSLTGNYSTIDLSSASDTIDSTLVHSIFREHGDFVEDTLLMARTPMIDVDGKTKIMVKFAGMGNATTFPVMSLIFSMLILGAMCDYDGVKPSYGRLKRYTSTFAVYGDDIAIPARYHGIVLEWLTEFGFVPNKGKSFSKGNFRESCGLDSYKGVSVTPIYIRAWPEDLKRNDAHSIASIVETSNLLWLEGLYEMSNYLKSWVESVLGTLPLVTKDSGALGWHTRKDVTTIERWNNTLHRFEYRSFSIKTKKILDRLDGVAALIKFFHTPCVEGSDLEDIRPRDHLINSAKRRATRVARGWFVA